MSRAGGAPFYQFEKGGGATPLPRLDTRLKPISTTHPTIGNMERSPHAVIRSIAPSVPPPLSTAGLTFASYNPEASGLALYATRRKSLRWPALPATSVAQCCSAKSCRDRDATVAATWGGSSVTCVPPCPSLATAKCVPCGESSVSTSVAWPLFTLRRWLAGSYFALAPA